METPPPEIDNIIEDPPVTSIPLSIDIIKEEILTTTNTIAESSQPTTGEVVFGDDMTGVKGYYATVTIRTDDSTQVSGAGGKTRELFAVSSEYVESSY